MTSHICGTKHPGTLLCLDENHGLQWEGRKATDDASGAKSCSDLRVWWDALCSAGLGFGCHTNASKPF